jgi:SAM-dependent methyltransferase
METQQRNSKEASNEALYDRLWARLPLQAHSDWPIWGDLEPELRGGLCLEVGAGVLPRSPVQGGYFVDLSQASLRKLRAHGGHGVRASGRLPFCDGAFSAVCMFEVLEHIPDDDQAIAEIARVLRPGGALLFSVPVNPAAYSGFDAACEHVRRYDARDLAQRLSAHGLDIERWATQRSRFRPGVGWLAGVLLRVANRVPALMLWLKRKALGQELSLKLHWRNDDITGSHLDGGLIAVARRRQI